MLLQHNNITAKVTAACFCTSKVHWNLAPMHSAIDPVVICSTSKQNQCSCSKLGEACRLTEILTVYGIIQMTVEVLV